MSYADHQRALRDEPTPRQRVVEAAKMWRQARVGFDGENGWTRLCKAEDALDAAVEALDG